MSTGFTSWGGLAARGSTALAPEAWRGSEPVLPYGNGRSYGDSCLLDQGGMIDMRGRRRIESFDQATGLLVAESGLLIADLLDVIVPAGWFMPVTPGTRYVTLGGALANDVHGKNHHARGTFGCHVAWFDLERSDGRTLRCSGLENRDLFAATIGGMGLTGLVTRLALQLIPVRGPMMRQNVIPFARLADFFALATASDASHHYTVAWIDQLATGSALGKGVFFRANHDESDSTPAPFRQRKPLPLLPVMPPVPLINRATLAGFNALYAFAHHRQVADARVPLEPFFYPLDRVGGWSRAYGPRGLRQHQSVVPAPLALDSVRELLLATQAAGEASFLTVLKLFGDRPSPGLMSFPMAGATLTLDLPYRGPRTDAVLAELDRITIAAGGRVNPYKDARMSPATFEASFPRWRDFARHIDPAFTSNFWRRVTG